MGSEMCIRDSLSAAGSRSDISINNRASLAHWSMNVMNYLKGKIKEAKMMIISPKTPINDIIGVTVLSV